MRTVAIVDTSICTDNLGDEIIMDAVNQVVWELFPDAYVFRVPSHEALSDRTHKFIGEASYCFIGGTNLLSSRIEPYGLWRLRLEDAYHYGGTHTVCLGTGWNDYMPRPTEHTGKILRTALTSDLIHSARDGYTRDHLAGVGLAAVNTSCPTTWSLTPDHCRTIPTARAPTAVFTLSAWRPDPAADRAFVDLLRRHYGRLRFFPQMQNDWDYCRSLGFDDVALVTPTTEGYTRFLENEDVDVIGTRLHGGVRALQKGRRALVLAIDNRATEIGKDTGLPVAARDDLAAITRWIEGAAPTALALPQDAIDAWKAQFRPEALERLPRPAPARFVPEPRRVGLDDVAALTKQVVKQALGRA